jgi:DMSO reductase anchor subunit
MSASWKTALGEMPLVLFTVLVQVSVGACLAGNPVVAAVTLGAGVLAATLHLGRPAAARYALANMRTSWLSREAALAGIFALGVAAFLGWPQNIVLWAVASGAGLALVGAIVKIYMIRTVPAWNSWLTPAMFSGTVLLSAGVVLASSIPDARWPAIAVAALAGINSTLSILLYARFLHARFGRREVAPWLGLRIGLALAGVLLLSPMTLLFGELAGRTLFYRAHRRTGL